MCLIVQDNKPLIAKEDIECYKILFKVTTDRYWKTLYMKYNITKYGKVYNNTESVEIKKPLFYYEINKGCYHTFANKDDAVEFALNSWMVYAGGLLKGFKAGIAKTIIPKGSEYYKGVFGARDGYASRAIIYNKPEIINLRKTIDHLFNLR